MINKFNSHFQPGEKIMYRNHIGDDWRQYIVECHAYRQFGKPYVRFVGIERQIELIDRNILWPGKKVKNDKIVVGVKNEILIYKKW